MNNSGGSNFLGSLFEKIDLNKVKDIRTLLGVVSFIYLLMFLRVIDLIKSNVFATSIVSVLLMFGFLYFMLELIKKSPELLDKVAEEQLKTGPANIHNSVKKQEDEAFGEEDE